jgi:hypothetical protein
MSVYRTVLGWNLVGRAIKPGERATAYRVSPDGTLAYAAFAEEQTLQVHLIDATWSLVHPDDRPPRPKPREPDGLSGDEDTGPAI